MVIDINLKDTFNADAELYHAIRPKYPKELFDKLIEVTNLSKNARLLEIGPGTGQATEPLVQKGYEITAVELGDDLARVAKEKLKDYLNVEVITNSFEDIDLPHESFDLVFSATAFHWIKEEVRFTKPHKLLKANGHLAIIHTEHVSDEKGDDFFFAVQPVYREYPVFHANKFDEDFRLPKKEDLTPMKIDNHLFDQVLFQVFPRVIQYTAQEYVQLLSTYSPVISAPKEMRDKFLAGIADVIESQFGGKIEKHFAMTLLVARKIPEDRDELDGEVN